MTYRIPSAAHLSLAWSAALFAGCIAVSQPPTTTFRPLDSENRPGGGEPSAILPLSPIPVSPPASGLRSRDTLQPTDLPNPDQNRGPDQDRVPVFPPDNGSATRGDLPEPSASVPRPVPLLRDPPAVPEAIPDGPVDLTVYASRRKQVGSTVAFHVRLRNRSAAPLEDVAVHCEFDPALKFAGSDEHEVLQRLGRMVPGEEKELTLGLSSETAGTHCCRFSLRHQNPRPERRELVWKSVCVEFVPQHLELSLVGPPRRTVGSRAEYNIRLTNHSSRVMPGVDVRLAHDTAIAVQEATQGAIVGDKGLTWSVGDVAPYEDIHLQVEFACKSAASRACVLVEVSGRDLPDDQQETCLEVVPVSGPLDLRLRDLNDPLAVGSVGEFEATVENTGLDPAGQIQLEITSTPELRVKSGQVSRGETPLPIAGRQVGDKFVFDVVPQLPVEGRLVYLLTVEGVAAGTGELRAAVTSQQVQTPLRTSEPTIVTAP